VKFVDEFRDGELAQTIARAIAAEARPERRYSFMEFCGGHTHAISRYGVTDLLPANVRMIHGPGCPVCVLPIGRVDQAIKLALERGVTLCTYGDTLRVPASESLSLLKAKARGADIRMVYSPADALKFAHEHPEREVVLRHRFRDHHAADRAHPQTSAGAEPAQLQRVVLPCAHAVGDHEHPRIARGAVARDGAHRRLRRPRACEHHHRQPAL